MDSKRKNIDVVYKKGKSDEFKMSSSAEVKVISEYPLKYLAKAINNIFQAYSGNSRDFNVDILRIHKIVIEGSIIRDIPLILAIENKNRESNSGFNARDSMMSEDVDFIVQKLINIPDQVHSTDDVKKWISGFHQGVFPNFLEFVNHNYTFFNKKFIFLPDKNTDVALYRIGSLFSFEGTLPIRNLIRDGYVFQLDETGHLKKEKDLSPNNDNKPIVCEIRILVSINLAKQQPEVTVNLKVTSYHDFLFYSGPRKCLEIIKLENIIKQKARKQIYNFHAYPAYEKQISEHISRSKGKIDSFLEVFFHAADNKILKEERLLSSIIKFYDSVLAFTVVKDSARRLDKEIISLSVTETFKEKISNCLKEYIRTVDDEALLLKSGNEVIQCLFFGYFTGSRQKEFETYLSQIHEGERLSKLYVLFYNNFTTGVLALKNLLNNFPGVFCENIKSDVDNITLKIRSAIVEIKNALETVLTRKNPSLIEDYSKTKIESINSLQNKIFAILEQESEKIEKYYSSEKGAGIKKQGIELFENLFEIMYANFETLVKKIFEKEHQFSELIEIAALELENIFRNIDDQFFLKLGELFLQEEFYKIRNTAFFFLRYPEKFSLVSTRENRIPFFKHDDVFKNKLDEYVEHLNKNEFGTLLAIGETVDGDESFFDAFWQGIEDLGATNLIDIPEKHQRDPVTFLRSLVSSEKTDFISQGQALCRMISGIKLHVIEFETQGNEEIKLKHNLVTASESYETKGEHLEKIYKNKRPGYIHLVKMMKSNSPAFAALIKYPGEIFVSRVSETILNVISGIQTALKKVANEKSIFFSGYYLNYKDINFNQIEPIFIKYFAKLMNSKDGSDPLNSLFAFKGFLAQAVKKATLIKRNSAPQAKNANDYQRKTRSFSVSNAEGKSSCFFENQNISVIKNSRLHTYTDPRTTEEVKEEVFEQEGGKEEYFEKDERVVVFKNITLPPSKRKMIFCPRNKSEELAVLWARNPFVESFKALGIHYSIDRFLMLYPSARDTFSPWLLFADLVGGTVGFLIGRHRVLNPNEPISRFSQIWSSNNSGLIVFIFSLDSAIKIYLKIHPEDGIISNQKFYSQIMPAPMFIFLSYTLWNSISENTKNQRFKSFVRSLVDGFFEFSLYSQYFGTFINNIFQTFSGIGYIILPYVLSAVTKASKLIFPKHQKKIDTTILYVMVLSLSSFLVKDLERQWSSNDNLTLFSAYTRLAFWLSNLTLSFAFICKNSLSFVEEYTGEPKVVYQIKLNDDHDDKNPRVSMSTFEKNFSRLKNPDGNESISDDKDSRFMENLKEIKKKIEQSTTDPKKSLLTNKGDEKNVLFYYKSFSDSYEKNSEEYNENINRKRQCTIL